LKLKSDATDVFETMDGLQPTEEYDGSITVRTHHDGGTRQEISCNTYTEAIETVKAERDSSTAVDIVASDGDIVFDSAEMKIEDWEVEWKRTKRRLSVDTEPRDCPYDNRACFDDDPCVRCQIDKVQAQTRS
jgi:hypothetical protein